MSDNFEHFNRELPPNAAKFMESFRHQGYKYTDAVCDLIDNSIDARATEIHVYLRGMRGSELGKGGKRHSNTLYINGHKSQIEVSDNGDGMDYDTIQEFLKLGSDTDKDNGSSLGKFGVGAKSGSLSMGRSIDVVTRSNGESWHAVLDLDAIVSQNKFCCFLEESTASSLGTKVVVSKIDRMTDDTVDAVEKVLKTKIGIVYGKFISNASVNIFVNGVAVEPIDPLLWNEPDTQQMLNTLEDEAIDLGNGETLHVKLAQIDEYRILDARGKTKLKDNQGFYIYRNGRCIAVAQTCDLYATRGDNYLNRFRGEISFSSRIDQTMGVNIRKQGVNFTQSVRDILKDRITPYLNNIKAKRRDEERKQVSSKIVRAQTEASKEIQDKINYLDLPKVEKEIRDHTGTKSKAKAKAKAAKSDAKSSRTPRKTRSVKTSVKFDNMQMGRQGPIYKVDIIKDVLMIDFNTDHPAYGPFFKNAKEPSVMKGFCHFIVPLATVELNYSDNDDARMAFDEVKSSLDRNMRILCGD